MLQTHSRPPAFEQASADTPTTIYLSPTATSLAATTTTEIFYTRSKQQTLRSSPTPGRKQKRSKTLGGQQHQHHQHHQHHLLSSPNTRIHRLEEQNTLCRSLTTIWLLFIQLIFVSCFIQRNCYASFIGDLELLATDVEPLNSDCPTVDLVSSLENRIALLERYVTLMGHDLKITQERLKEREKCDCTISCHYNGTKYADQTSWQNGCETCKCQFGQVTCKPNPCPIVCDDAVMVPGQCCPICPKSCKYNGTTYSHGKNVYSNSDRTCKCNDGHIQCENSPALPSIRMTLSNIYIKN